MDLIVAISDLILVLIAAIRSVLGVLVARLIVLPHYEAGTMRFWGPNSAIRCFGISQFLIMKLIVRPVQYYLRPVEYYQSAWRGHN